MVCLLHNSHKVLLDHNNHSNLSILAVLSLVQFSYNHKLIYQQCKFSIHLLYCSKH